MVMTSPPNRSYELYQRPPDWLPLPPVADTDSKFVGLHAVYSHDANFVALTAAGAYTVDWGDGTVENIATGVQANHNYSYASISAATTTTRGYRQVIVTVTPQAGQTFTALNLNKKHSQTGLVTGYGTGWLDIAVASATLATLGIGEATNVVTHTALERCNIYAGAATGVASMFTNTSALQHLTARFPNVTNSGSMFGAMQSLRIVTDLEMPKAITSTTSLFANAPALQYVDGLDLAAATDASSLFTGCVSLVEVNNLNIPKATTLANAFNGCTALRSVNSINSPLVATFTQMFSGCSSLRTVTGLNTSAGTAFGSMFNNCAALAFGPALDTSQGTTFSLMFGSCKSLQSIPAYDTSKGTVFTSMFTGCTALQSIPALNLGAGTGVSTMWSGCSSLSSIAAYGAKISISVGSCRLSASALNAFYTGLASGVSAQTVTVTSNYGTTGDDPTIATAKGWTVTGS